MEKEEAMKKEEEYIGQWHMGHIALFGAMLMSKGIVGEEKEELKKMMYKALKTESEPMLEDEGYDPETSS